MPRIASESAALLADLMSRLGRVVDVALAEGHAQALHEIRSLVAGGGGAVKRGPGRPRGSKNKPKATTKSGKRRKNPWASMTAEQRAERVRKMLAGRGLKPKGG